MATEKVEDTKGDLTEDPPRHPPTKAREQRWRNGKGKLNSKKLELTTEGLVFNI